MTLDRLRYFVAVAQELNFTRAAQSCHIAQTAMSRQIAMLEQEIGCRLLERDNRTVTLTPAGQVFYEGAVLLLEQYRQTLERTKTAKESLGGNLRVGIGLYERQFVSELVGEFVQAYPNIQVNVSQYHYKDLVDNLRKGAVDVIFALPVTAEYMAEEPVEIQELFTSELRMVMSRTYPLANRKILCREDITGECNVTISEEDGPCSLKDYRMRMRRSGAIFSKTIQANSLESEFLMLEAGMGIAFLPNFLEENLPPKLIMIPLEEGMYPREKFVSMIRQDNKNPAARFFVEGIQTSRTLWERLEQAKEVSES